MIKEMTIDVLLIGGGITGLWAFNRLYQLGYSVALLEQDELGAGQTIKSQGIIHGGIKYALTGFLNKSSQNIATMPKRWQQCLEGTGEIDLRKVNILSNEQFLWSTGNLTSNLTSFFASKALKSRVKKCAPKSYPLPLQHPQFKGNVYKLEEIVLDIPSLIKVLAKPYFTSFFKIAADTDLQIEEKSNEIQSITLTSKFSNAPVKCEKLRLNAKRYIFCAGEGNAQLLSQFNTPIQMQYRPLHMVLVELNKSYPFYAHCIEGGTNPRITITTHTSNKGQCIWYLGGQIAEEGVQRTSKEQCEFAKKELMHLFPWIEWENTKFSSFYVNRAEGKEEGSLRPDSFFLQPFGNAFAAWPTKLAFVPLLCDELIRYLERDQIMPSGHEKLHGKLAEDLTIHETFERPAIAMPPWDILLG